MKRSRILLIIYFIIIVSPTPLFSAKTPVEIKRINPAAKSDMITPFVDHVFDNKTEIVPLNRSSLGKASSSISPGVVIGYTWYDQQHNGSMGRMIEFHDSDSLAAVHMSWMYMPGPAFANRVYMYNSYDLTNQEWGGSSSPQSDSGYGGYVSISVTNDNRGVIGGHSKGVDGLYNPTYFWDVAPLNAYWGYSIQVPKILQNYMAEPSQIPQDVIWPKARYIETPTDTFLHIIAQVSNPDAGDPQAIYYFRRVGAEDNPAGVWDDPPFIVDTVYDLSHDVAAAEAGGKVALVWTANLPCEGLGGNAPSGDEIDCGGTYNRYSQWDNDIWYITSDNNGDTWNTRVNVTKYADGELEQDEYRPYTDLNCLIDSKDTLHIVWGGSRWLTTAYSDGDAGFYANRIFHWSENWPYERTVQNADWDQTQCNGGAWCLNASKMTISECRGKFYVLFTQFNDIPDGVEDDCADQGNPGYPGGAANGELYISVSADGGLTWDPARNITNTRTPGCDSVGGLGGPCESEHWASMSRFGTNIGDPNDPNIATVIPDGLSDVDYYLDVQYINDHSAGSIVKDDGTWQQADVRWFRMACVDQVEQVCPSPIPNLTWPTYTLQCEEYSVEYVLENNGNTDLNYSFIIEEDNGPPGWLYQTPPSSGSIPSGLNNTRRFTITINKDGIVCNALENDRLIGRIIIISNMNSSPDTIKVDAMVLSNPPVYDVDTINTSCLSLVCKNDGSYGNQGDKNVNMDYVNNGDCDTSANIYLYDASSIIGWIDGPDTNMYWSVFGTYWADSNGFFSMEANENYTENDFEITKSKFGLRDSSIAMEKTYYAYQDPDSCNYIIQNLKVWSNDSADHDNLIIGEVVDWDIPADSGSRNGSGFSDYYDWMAIWQFGGTYDDSLDYHEPCYPLKNDTRIGGMAFLTMYESDGTTNTLVPGDDLGRPFHNAYTVDNPTFVYGNDHGFDVTELCSLMTINDGFSKYYPNSPESIYTDLHSTITFTDSYDLTAGETLNIWFSTFTTPIGSDTTIMGEIIEKSRSTFCEYLSPPDIDTYPPICGCCVKRGDLLHDNGLILVNDLVFFVNYIFKGGPPALCPEEMDANDDGEINVSDVVCLVNVVFKGLPGCLQEC